MAHIYNFAIIRVSPDPRRGEVVNIGLVVFLRASVDVRILPSLSKVQALYGELDLAELYALPKKFAKLLPGRASTKARYEMMRQIGMMELSELGQFEAVGNDDYETVVDGLMVKLVRPTPLRREREASASKLHAEVRKIIKDAKLLGRATDNLDNHKVIPNYGLAPEKGLYADFAGKNSQYYITETIDYRVERGLFGAKFNESTKAALVLREAARQFVNSNRTVLYAASSQVEAKVQTHLTLLSEFATEFVNFSSAQDRARFVQTLANAFGGQLPFK
jgi:hypothetical protein